MFVYKDKTSNCSNIIFIFEDHNNVAGINISNFFFRVILSGATSHGQNEKKHKVLTDKHERFSNSCRCDFYREGKRTL